MDPPTEDIKYDLQRLHCWLDRSAETYRLCGVVFASFLFHTSERRILNLHYLNIR